MKRAPPTASGLRERKRLETLHRIAKTSFRLFSTKGYEETTLDDISAAAGISRRTFFHYFKSKDEILLAWQTGVVASIRAAILEETAEQPPIGALCNALMKLARRHSSDTSIALARLLKSSDQLRAANQAKYLLMEQAAFESLCRLWPKRGQQERLRMVAIIGLAAFRSAVDGWTDEGGQQPFPKYLEDTFANLRSAL